MAGGVGLGGTILGVPETVDEWLWGAPVAPMGIKVAPAPVPAPAPAPAVWRLSAKAAFPETKAEYGSFVYGLNWELDRPAGPDGGLIFQRVKITGTRNGGPAGLDYIEVFAVAKGQKTATDASLLPGMALQEEQTVAELKKAGFTAKQIETLKATSASDWQFTINPNPNSFGDVRREVTAFYVDGVSVFDVFPDVVGFGRGEVPEAGSLPSRKVKENETELTLAQIFNQKIAPALKKGNVGIMSNIYSWGIDTKWRR